MSERGAGGRHKFGEFRAGRGIGQACAGGGWDTGRLSSIEIQGCQLPVVILAFFSGYRKYYVRLIGMYVNRVFQVHYNNLYQQ